MNQQQKGILWIGVLVVLIFLFTDQSFRDQIFGRGSAKPAAASVPFTAAAIIMDAQSGIPNSSPPAKSSGNSGITVA